MPDDDDRDARVELIGRLKDRNLSRHNILLRLSSDLALQRELTLPTAISDVIENVLINQVEQIVPWPPSQTSFGYQICDQQRSDDKVVVRLAALRQNSVEAAIAQAEIYGFEPSKIDISENVEQASGIELINSGGQGTICST